MRSPETASSPATNGSLLTTPQADPRDAAAGRPGSYLTPSKEHPWASKRTRAGRSNFDMVC